MGFHGQTHTEESRAKISASNRGRKLSISTKKKISEKNKKQKVSITCLNCSALVFLRKCEAKNRKYCSHKCVHESEDYRIKRSEISKRLRGPLSPLWRGGRTSELKTLRGSAEYDTWRKAVKERDKNTCQMCGRRGWKAGSRLEVDHIKAFALHPESRFDINNGRTLCHECHVSTDTFGWKVFNSRKVKTL